jgi:hypothetical protein
MLKQRAGIAVGMLDVEATAGIAVGMFVDFSSLLYRLNSQYNDTDTESKRYPGQRTSVIVHVIQTYTSLNNNSFLTSVKSKVLCE